VLRETIGKPVPPNRRGAYDRDLTAARAKLGEAAFAAAWAEGCALRQDHAVDEALACEIGPAEAASGGGHSSPRQDGPAPVPAQTGIPNGLTAREIEVLRLVAAGKSNAEIAEALVVSIRTAERHLANIYAKLGTGGAVARAAATSYAHVHGVVQPNRS
jgi:DNA-binding NarL/FixJ family response regulator